MSANPFEIPPNVEQDRAGGDILPTYDDLAQQSGPNSRFGRWKGWIEKRAAERYADITPEERNRRRERGWEGLQPAQQASSDPFVQLSQQEISESPGALHVQTVFTEAPETISQPATQPIIPNSLPLISQTLEPTHLVINQFGSRFLPHTMSPIRCLLPLYSDRVLLIGHDEGLSVLDMFPHETTEEGEVVHKGPDEAQARLIWEGEGVYQMSIIEEDDGGENGPQGVVLALVGPNSSSSPFSKESESLRSLRMYSLSSLSNLAKWTLAQHLQHGYRPLDMRSSSMPSQQSVKKHRPQGSITRSLKSIIDSSASSSTTLEVVSSYSEIFSPSSPIGSTTTLVHPHPKHQDSGDSTWDIVDELPLRWATDFVPFASPGTRLAGLSVRNYAFWSDETSSVSGGASLAVATKSNIMLYETPRGERAFRFVKDFYTPMQPRAISVIYQSVQDIIRRPSESLNIPARFHQQAACSGSGPSSHKRSDSNTTLRGAVSPPPSHTSTTSTTNLLGDSSYDTQRSLFVIFDKKAGWIRLSDSVVGEIELYDGGLADLHPMRDGFALPVSSARARRSSLGYTHKGPWIPPVRVDFPVPSEYTSPGSGRRPTNSRSVYLLTRGKQTHILPFPLPTNVSTCPAFRILYWESNPTSITARVCLPSPSSANAAAAAAANHISNGTNSDPAIPMLQIISLGEGGVEVQEIPLTAWGKGKGKARVGDLLRSQADFGGATGFLCHGGHWDELPPPPSSPSGPSSSHGGLTARPSYSGSFLSDETVTSHVGLGSNNQGIYGWCRKGIHDWRVFWLGGSLDKSSDRKKV